MYDTSTVSKLWQHPILPHPQQITFTEHAKHKTEQKRAKEHKSHLLKQD